MGRSHSKGKRLEKKTGKFLLKYDGKCPNWGELTTETGRTGQLSDCRWILLSRSYATECKNGTHVPTTIFKWFEQITEISAKHNKQPLLVLQVDGRSYKPNLLHCITPERHAELLECEKIAQEL